MSPYDMPIILLRHIGTQHAARFMLEALFPAPEVLTPYVRYSMVWNGTIQYSTVRRHVWYTDRPSSPAP